MKLATLKNGSRDGAWSSSAATCAVPARAAIAATLQAALDNWDAVAPRWSRPTPR
jgi:fumarylacetoacetate (FAA) hydrolase